MSGYIALPFVIESKEQLEEWLKENFWILEEIEQTEEDQKNYG